MRAALIGRGGDLIGTGHWTRLLALSRALTERGYQCHLVTDHPDHPALHDSPIPLRATVSYAPLVIQDPPRPLRQGDQVVCIVDGPATLFHADLVVYPHFDSPTIKTRGTLLLGPAYACLRPPFAEAHPSCQPDPQPIERVLVACGGSRLGRMVADEIGATLVTKGYTPVFLDTVGYFGDVVGVMRSCQAAVTTASMTALEALCCGLPLLTVGFTAEHARLGTALATANVAGPYTEALAWSWDQASRGWAAVDGQGIYRVADAIARSRSARARSSSD